MMRERLRNRIRKITYLVVFAGFSSANAGAYDDFFQAIRVDDEQKVEAFLRRGVDPNTLDPKGLHGLFLAAREPSPKVARTLLAWPRIDPDARNAQDETPLMIAALRGDLDLARRLVEKGADVNKTGWTPLHYAATHGHLAVMRLLLEQHAYIDAESPNGTTPLMMAARYGTPAAVKLLLEEGADPALKNRLGLDAIAFALSAERKDAAELIAAFIRARQPAGKW
jgi:hypothetical protein